MTTVQNTIGSRRFLVALAAAGAVFAVLAVQRLLGLFGSYLVSAGSGAVDNYLLGALPQTVLSAVPFALGLLIVLWIAPISEGLTLSSVLGRAALASAAGAVVAGVIGAAVQFVGALGLRGSLFGNSFPGVRYDGPGALQSVGWAVHSAFQSFLTITPLVLLVAVLLWIWLRRSTTAKSENTSHDSV